MSPTLKSKSIQRLSTGAMLFLITLLGSLLWGKPWQPSASAGLALGQTLQNSTPSATQQTGTKLGQKLNPDTPGLGKHLGNSLKSFADPKIVMQPPTRKLGSAQVSGGVAASVDRSKQRFAKQI